MPSNKRSPLFVIGLDCFDPTLTFDWWLDDLPNLQNAGGTGLVRATGKHHAADHRACVDLHADRQGPGRARVLWVSESGRLFVCRGKRPDDDRRCRSDRAPTSLGSCLWRRAESNRGRGSADLPGQTAEWHHGFRVPDAQHQERLYPPARVQARDRRPVRAKQPGRVYARRARLSHR